MPNGGLPPMTQEQQQFISGTAPTQMVLPGGTVVDLTTNTMFDPTTGKMVPITMEGLRAEVGRITAQAQELNRQYGVALAAGDFAAMKRLQTQALGLRQRLDSLTGLQSRAAAGGAGGADPCANPQTLADVFACQEQGGAGGAGGGGADGAGGGGAGGGGGGGLPPITGGLLPAIDPTTGQPIPGLFINPNTGGLVDTTAGGAGGGLTAEQQLGENTTDRAFRAEQNALDRAQQLQIIDSNQRNALEELARREIFEGQQNAMDRAQQLGIVSAEQAGALGRVRIQEAGATQRLGTQLTFEEKQAVADRAFRKEQSALDRALQLQIIDVNQHNALEELARRQIFEGEQNAMDRAQQLGIVSAEQAGALERVRVQEAGATERLGTQLQSEEQRAAEERKLTRQRLFVETLGTDPVRAALFALGVGGPLLPGGEQFEGLPPLAGAETFAQQTTQALESALGRPTGAIQLGAQGVTGLQPAVKAATAFQTGGGAEQTLLSSAFGVGSRAPGEQPGLRPQELEDIIRSVTPMGTLPSL